MSEVTWLRPLFVNAGGFTVQVGLTVNGEWRLHGSAQEELELDGRDLLPLMQDGYGGTRKQAHRMIADRLRESRIG